MTDDAFQIVAAVEEDFKKIANLINENIDLTRRYDENVCKKCGVDFFLVKSDNNIVGCGGLKKITKNACKLAHVLIKKEFRNRGLGKMLINFLIDKAFERNFRKVFATVNIKNEVMIKIFEKMGFKREGLLKHHFAKNRHIHIYAKYK